MKLLFMHDCYKLWKLKRGLFCVFILPSIVLQIICCVLFSWGIGNSKCAEIAVVSDLNRVKNFLEIECKRSGVDTENVKLYTNQIKVMRDYYRGDLKAIIQVNSEQETIVISYAENKSITYITKKEVEMLAKELQLYLEDNIAYSSRGDYTLSVKTVTLSTEKEINNHILAYYIQYFYLLSLIYVTLLLVYLNRNFMIRKSSVSSFMLIHLSGMPVQNIYFIKYMFVVFIAVLSVFFTELTHYLSMRYYWIKIKEIETTYIDNYTMVIVQTFLFLIIEIVCINLLVAAYYAFEKSSLEGEVS